MLVLTVCACTIHKRMSMMVEGHPCDREAAELEHFIRAVVALPTPAVPLIMNCSPSQDYCGARPSRPWDGSEIEKQLGRCSARTDRGKEFSVTLICISLQLQATLVELCCRLAARVTHAHMGEAQRVALLPLHQCCCCCMQCLQVWWPLFTA